jgi:hypothetical protein
MPIILATQEAEIRRIAVQNQPWANSSRDPVSKTPSQKRDGGVAQGVGSEFKPQYHKKKLYFLTQTVLKFCIPDDELTIKLKNMLCFI